MSSYVDYQYLKTDETFGDIRAKVKEQAETIDRLTREIVAKSSALQVATGALKSFNEQLEEQAETILALQRQIEELQRVRVPRTIAVIRSHE